MAEHGAVALRGACGRKDFRWRTWASIQRSTEIGRRRWPVRPWPRGLGHHRAALLCIPADFTITARGELEPAGRREVFASVDGLVDEIRVEHGSQVKQGETLVVLRRPQLEFEASRVAGELLTSRSGLAAVQAARLATNANDAAAVERYNQLTAEKRN